MIFPALLLLSLVALMKAARIPATNLSPHLYFNNKSAIRFIPNEKIQYDHNLQITAKISDTKFFRLFKSFDLSYEELLLHAFHCYSTVYAAMYEFHLANESCQKMVANVNKVYDDFVDDYLRSKWVPRMYPPRQLPISLKPCPYSNVLDKLVEMKINVEKPYLDILWDTVSKTENMYDDAARLSTQLGLCVDMLRGREKERYAGIPSPTFAPLYSGGHN